MFIPIITVFSDVVRLFTFQPPRVEGSIPFRRPCPEAEHDRPPAERPAAVLSPAVARRPDLRDKKAARPQLLPQAERC